MKNLFLLLLCFAAFQTANAQCTINSSVLTSPGVYPPADSLPCITIGSFYDVTLQGMIDTAYDSAYTYLGQLVDVHFRVDSIRFDSIAGLPSGIQWVQSPLILPGGGHGCIRFSGVTNDPPGNYPLTAYGTSWVYVNDTVMGITFDSSYIYTGILNDYSPFDGYYLTICDYSVNLGTDQTACAGSVVTLNTNVTGGVAPYTYVWSQTGDALSCTNCKHPVVTLTQNSSYSVTVIDANNQQVTDNVSYTLGAGNNTMQLAVTNTGIDCLHLQDTTVVTVTGGTAAYTFNWGDGTSVTGTSVEEHIYPQAGDYVIAVTDNASCVSSVLNTVVYDGIFIQETGRTLPDCENMNTGLIAASATNGTAPYSFAWSSSSTTNTAMNIEAGNYSVTVTDAASCSAVAHYSLAPANGWGYYTYLTPSVTNCSNNGTVINTVFGGAPPFTFAWSNGGTAQNLNGLSGGVYSVVVTDNLGCTTSGQTTVPSDCYSIISGIAFNDTNSNCLFDIGETYAQGIFVLASGNGQNYYGTTLGNGTYSIQVPAAGTYTLSTYSYGDVCANTTMCNNPNHTVTLATLGDTSANNNFVLDVTPGFDLSVFMRWSSGNPGFLKDYRIYPYNASSIPFTGQATVVFGYDSNLIYQSSNLPVIHNLADHSLTWTVDSVNNYWFWGGNEILASFLVPINANLGQLVTSQFSISPTIGDCDSSNNHITITDEITGSFDPNEKKVSPAGGVFEEDSVLTYTIGFQNTGNDSTHFIILKDTLSSHLDPSTVRNIASSHPYSEFTVSGQGILTWTFNPLRLVDSFTNEPGSHGFVMFTIKKKKNLPIGTIISNKASIYFDYNEPVVTNTVTNTIADPNFIFELRSNAAVSVKAFPNPFSSSTTILVEGIQSKFDFELYDVTGRLRRKISSIENNQFSISKNELSSGVYFFKIVTGGNNRSGHGKLVVE